MEKLIFPNSANGFNDITLFKIGIFSIVSKTNGQTAIDIVV